MPFWLHKVLVHLHTLTTLKNLHFSASTFRWRMSYRCHYTFMNIPKSVQALIFMSLFIFFTVHSFHAHYCIVSIPRTYQTRLLPYILKVFAFLYLIFWFVSYMAATATLQLTFVHYVEAIIPQHSGSQPPCSENFSTCRNAILWTIFDSLYVMCKTHYRKWQLSEWRLS